MVKPPPFAEKILGWLLDDLWYTPLGDFEEYFHEKVEELGAPRARWWYRGQVLRMLPDRLFQKTYWASVMISTYLKLAYRNLLKNKAAASINIIGLSIAIACTIVAYLFVHSKVVRDNFHEHTDNIFLVEQVMTENDESYLYSQTPFPLGPSIVDEIPQVESAVRIKEWRAEVTHDDNRFGQNMSFVDDNFLEMFTFPIKYGDASELKNRNAIILSARSAERYYGTENPVGQVLDIAVIPGQVQPFTIAAVTEHFPPNTAYDFSLLLHIDNLPPLEESNASNWIRNITTFVKVADPNEKESVEQQMGAFVAPANAANINTTTEAFVLENLQSLTYSASTVRNPVVGGIPLGPVIVLSVISIFLLSLACLNYINIALSTATRRLKEIGVRKVMGSTRRQLVEQFFAENILVCFVALIVGILIAGLFLLPAFDDITNFGLSIWGRHSLHLFGFLGVLLLFISVVSGVYPSLYVASFQPVNIFRGKRHINKKRRFTHALLSFQFMLASIAMMSSIAFVLNDGYQESLDWGYDNENILVLSFDDNQAYELVSNAASQLPAVLSSSGSKSHIGRTHNYRKARLGDEEFDVLQYEVGPSYAQTMGLSMVAGKFFNPDLLAEEDGVVINETFAHIHQIDDLSVHQVRLDSTYHPILGIVSDFYYEGFFNTISPVVLTKSTLSEHTFLTMKLEAGAAAQTVKSLEAVWAELPVDNTLPFFFQDTVFDHQFREGRGITTILLFATSMALLIACMGLFGMVAQNISSRMKEIGVRKVLGASLGQITRRVNRHFLLLLGIAVLVATPISWIFVNMLLDSVYAYHQSMSFWPVALSYLLIFATAALTISTQIYRVSVVNPTDVLRNE
ncbi:MAG: ABC transporter permease [Bacteroidota bacterium]